MEQANGADGVEPIFERGERRRLGKEHQEAVETFVQIRVAVGFEELEAKVFEYCQRIHLRRVSIGRTCEDR